MTPRKLHPAGRRPPMAVRVPELLEALVPALLVALVAVSLAAAAAVAAEPDQPIRGVVRAIRQAALSTDLPMRIVRLPFREGQLFEAGELLVEFDCRRQKADLQAAGALVREAEINAASSRSLDKYKAIGRNDVEIAAARLDKARGELKSLQARVEDCTVFAPFRGRVSESVLHELEFTAPQKPFLAIVEDGRSEIQMIVSSAMLAAIEIGQRLVFVADELPGIEIRAVVSSVGSVVDPVSKTAKVLADIDGANVRLTVGMSGTATFQARAN